MAGDDERCTLFLLLLDIADVFLAPEISQDEVSLLLTMISDQKFYPSASVTPKFHYLVHMPRLITDTSMCMQPLTIMLANEGHKQASVCVLCIGTD